MQYFCNAQGGALIGAGGAGVGKVAGHTLLRTKGTGASRRFLYNMGSLYLEIYNSC